MMADNSTPRSNFWLITVIGSFLVLLVVALGISFFYAIYFAQVNSRKDFLISQTALAARGLEVELNRFKEGSNILLTYLEDPDLDQEDLLDDFSVAVRRTFTDFPSMIDSIWVDLNDSVLVFTLTDRNDFIRKKANGEAFLADKGTHLLVSGKLGFEILYLLDIPKYSQEYATNFYLNSGGEKYLFYEDDLLPIGSRRSAPGVKLDDEDFEQIRSDIRLGLKGFYEVSWTKGDRSFSGILAQYPFSYGGKDTPASLVFFVPMDGLSSGFYSTYLALFLGAVVLLFGMVSFLIISLKGNVNSIKVQEANLKEISRLFDQQNLLLQELKGFVFFHNQKGEIIKVSDEVTQVLGHDKREFFDAFRADTDHPQAKVVKAEVIKALNENRNYLDLEYDFTKPDSESIRLRVFIKLIFDQHGKFSGGLGICTDITSQYLAQQDTIQSEKRLRTLINSIPDTIFIYNNFGVVLDFHVQDKINLHEPAFKTLGKSLREFVPHGQADDVIRVFEMAKSTNSIQTVNVEWKSTVGDRYYEIRFFPLDENQVMSISKDITGQKIWEKGLMEAMNAADLANRSKSEFLANMSHEIRTPMNGLLGIIDLLEGTNLNRIQKQYVEIIKNSGSSLLNIIRDILDYSKIESGKIDIQPTIFKPEDELISQIKILSGLAGKKNIRLETTLVNCDQKVFEADKGKINQVLLNLIGNAIKFTPEAGKVGVKMELSPIDDTLYFLSFEISDTGIGIAAEHIKNLTQPFYQVDSSNTRTHQGTGLGLAIAKKIVELMGGELMIESNPGQGSIFSFSVIVKKSSQDHLVSDSQQLTWKDIKDMGTLFPLRILLAEDNELNIKLMKLMFQQLGFEFEVAKNGREVLDQVKEQHFDVILMDVQMPVMNGLEATREIRKMEGTDQIIIIGLSANVFEEDQRKALESGMNDYLTKPIRLAALADKLEYYYRKVKDKAD